MVLTEKQLKSIVPNIRQANLILYTHLLNEAFEKYNINRLERVCSFISQVAHESGSFNYTEEIADGSAYEWRKDLGNTKLGDGKKFKGRGLIQVTGKANYERCSLYLFNDKRLLDKPELLSQPKDAVASACWYWYYRSLNDICDKPEDWFIEWRGKRRTRFEWITIKINGGLNGYNDRLKYYIKAKEVLKPAYVLEQDIPPARPPELIK